MLLWYCSFSSLKQHSCTFAWWNLMEPGFLWKNELWMCRYCLLFFNVIFTSFYPAVQRWVTKTLTGRASSSAQQLVSAPGLLGPHSSDAALPSWEHWLSYSHLQRMTKMCVSISHSLSHLYFCLPSVQMPLWQHAHYTKSSGRGSPFCAESSLLQALLIMDSVYLNL